MKQDKTLFQYIDSEHGMKALSKAKQAISKMYLRQWVVEARLKRNMPR